MTARANAQPSGGDGAMDVLRKALATGEGTVTGDQIVALLDRLAAAERVVEAVLALHTTEHWDRMRRLRRQRIPGHRFAPDVVVAVADYLDATNPDTGGDDA